jgi:inosine-uridine nucleoside N-ribohydrolase
MIIKHFGQSLALTQQSRVLTAKSATLEATSEAFSPPRVGDTFNGSTAVKSSSPNISVTPPSAENASPVPESAASPADVPTTLADFGSSIEQVKEVPQLSPLEVATLQELSPTGPPKSVLVFTDIGRDQDDELALSVLAKFQHMGNIDLKGVVTSLGPSDKRGQLAKGALRELGLPDVPVAVGSAAGQPTDKHHDYEFDAPYLADPASLEKDGQAFLKKQFESADDKSLTLLAVGPMTDLNTFMVENRELFQQKAEKVVIMGGIVRAEGAVSLTDGYMTPDTANNNTFDKDASASLYKGLQDLGIPTTVLTKEAAYAAPVDKSFYESLGGTGNEVGERLRASQRRSIEGLWNRVIIPFGDEARGGLPERLNRQWFEETFCDAPVPKGAEVWDSVTKLPVYDALAGLAVLDDAQSSKLFSPTTVEVNGTSHRVIGLSKDDEGMGRINSKLAMAALSKSVMLDNR